jgi:hypothetical protein
MANILQHSKRSVIASTWWLERNYPNEFALRTAVRDTNNSAEPLVCERMSIQQLVENARLAKQIADNPPPGLSGAPPRSKLGGRNERLKEAEAVRFNLRHERALESLIAVGERSWMVHAWWLERCLPRL